MTKAHAMMFGIIAIKPHKSIARMVARTKPKMITTIHQGLVIFNLYIFNIYYYYLSEESMREFLKVAAQILSGSVRMILSFFIILLIAVFLGYIAQYVPIQTFLNIVPEVDSGYLESLTYYETYLS